MRFQPVKHPQLKIIIPPSHPSQSSTSETQFSPIKPLFEGLSFEPQITSRTKVSPVANITCGSSLSRKTSSPQCRSATSETLAGGTLLGAEKLLPTQGRLRTVLINSSTQGSAENNASSCQSSKF